MRRRASSVMSHAAMIKLFQKHRNIKYLENGLHRHATHVFLKYTSTGGYAKNPKLLWNLTIIEANRNRMDRIRGHLLKGLECKAKLTLDVAASCHRIL